MDKKKELSKEDLANDFVKSLGDLESIEEVKKMIEDNKIKFEIKGIKYKVRQLTFEEQKELENFRRKKYLEFMNDDSMMFQKQWIKKYKTKGIDIDEMEQKIRENLRQENQIMLKLAQTNTEDRVADLKSQIIELRKESALINIERTDLLNFSIEDQLMIAVNSYYTYLSLEKLTEDKKYIRVFKDIDEFNKSQNTKLINKAFHYTNTIIYQSGF